MQWLPKSEQLRRAALPTEAPQSPEGIFCTQWLKQSGLGRQLPDSKRCLPAVCRVWEHIVNGENTAR